ncbi:AraC family transcriptional regulator [Cohnella sp. REN36]|uniref:AraC family transcriptional regulator n=1 Tax=Cohnella sp. REN36 TaxID=2887347 RepID=UPI001D15C094|nr:AraC family transcriptional regulator [Cohnella sp. REN36]MCC3373605.1 AraC family transcriptional regulator [Cohnella sp. REN36]
MNPFPEFYSEAQQDPSFPFAILRYSSQQLNQPMHVHNYIQFVYVLRGVCHHQMRGKLLKVSRGDLFIIAQHTEHSLRAIEGTDFEVAVIDFMPSMVREYLRPYTDTLHPLLEPIDLDEPLSPEYQSWIHLSKEKQAFVELILQDMQEEYEHREVGYRSSILLNLARLLILIDRHSRKIKRTSARQAPGAGTSPIEAVKRYIYDNYSGDIPLEQAVYIANMAPAYFSHQFKKETGQNFVDFVNEVRIERAMELIRRGTHTITSIGFLVGFRHLSHFIRTFKKRCGITPTEYKKTFGK